MSLTKIVDGISVPMSPEEEAATLADWTPTQAQIDAAAQAAADKAAAQAVRADAKYQALIALNPVGAAAGSVKDWVVNNFPTLTQPEKNNLTTVVQALVLTARKL